MFAQLKPITCIVSLAGSPLRVPLPSSLSTLTSVPMMAMFRRGSAEAFGSEEGPGVQCPEHSPENGHVLHMD